MRNSAWERSGDGFVRMLSAAAAAAEGSLSVSSGGVLSPAIMVSKIGETGAGMASRYGSIVVVVSMGA